MNSKVCIICGGTSSERLVSVATAQNVVNYFLNPDIYFISADGLWYQITQEQLLQHRNPFVEALVPLGSPLGKGINEMLPYLNQKIVFISLHGTEGEDGSLQKVLESNRIAFTGSGAISSALCFDKKETKEKLRGSDIRLAEELKVDFESPKQIESLDLFFSKHKNIVLKPIANGSSFGLHIIMSPQSYESAKKQIAQSDVKDYLAEVFIAGREITVGVFERDGELTALVPSEVILDRNSHFDYEGKYLGRGSQEITPANLTAVEKNQCQQLALRAHQILGCYGYSRTDMILTNDGPVFLETNTLPGLTKASFYPQQLAADKISFQKFIDGQLQLAQSRYQKV